MFCASVDLPVPLGPVSTTLVASLRKSSCISPSMPARSQPLGPARGEGFVPIGQQAVQVQGLGAGAQNAWITHRRLLSADRRVPGGRAARGYLLPVHGPAG